MVNFNSDDCSSNNPGGNGNGLTMESLYAAEILAYSLKDKEIKEKVETKLKNAISKLL